MTRTNLLDLCDNNMRITYFSVNRASRNETHPRYTCLKGTRPYSRLFFVLSGKTHFKARDVNGESYSLWASAGDIVYLPDDVEYESFWDDPEDINYMSIAFTLEGDSGQKLIFSERIDIIVSDRQELFRLAFENIVSSWYRGELGYRLKCSSMFLDLLHMLLLENAKQLYGKSHGEIYKGILYLENHYLDDIEPDALARLCGMSPSSFRSHFQAIKGMSPVQYKNYLKMKRASELLRSGEYTVSEVSEAVGCSDVYYFSKLFKRTYGVSPKKYSSSS